MFNNHNDDGLFKNPENQESGVTLEDIKSDTSSIASILNKYGGKQIAALKKVEQETVKGTKAAQKQQKNPQNKKNNKTANSRIEKPAKEAIDVVHNNVSRVVRKSSAGKQHPKDNQEQLTTPGRDANGRFTSSKDKQDEIKDEKKQSKILGALGEIGSNVKASVDTDNIDPTIDALKEIKGAFDVGTAIATPIGRGFGGLFRQNKTEAKWYSRFFKFYTKRQKEQHKHEEEMEDLSNAAGDGDSGFGILGSLFSFIKKYIPLLGGLSAVAGLLGKVFSLITKMVLPGARSGSEFQASGNKGRGRAKNAGGVSSGKVKTTTAGPASKIKSGGTAAKAEKVLSGVKPGKAGLLGKVAKGGGKFLKRVPLLGALFTGAQVISSLNDDSVDETGASNKAKGIGGAIGGVVGGAIGTLAGPMGTVVGGIVGDVIGTKLGAFVSKLDSPLEGVSSAIDSVKGWFTSGTENQYHVANDNKKVSYSNNAYTAGNITGMDAKQTIAIMQALAQRESGGILNKENKFGYLGQYQFGAQALVDAGLIDREKFEKASKGVKSGGNAKEHMAFLDDPSNWKIKGGKEAFLNSREMQDKAVQTLWNKNAKTFKNTNGRDFKDAKEAGGWLMASHLTGAGNANKLIRGEGNKADRFSTSTAEYYDLGSNSIGQANNAYIKPAGPASGNSGIKLTQTSYSPYNPTTVQKQVSTDVDRRQRTQKAVQENRLRTERNNLKRTQNSKSEKERKSQGNDPIFALLTQDVSDRNIAHIVTGGISGSKRSVM